MTMPPDILRRATFPLRLRFTSLLARLARADARYRQMRNLERLDARLLRDIGITAADARRELNRSIWS